MSGVLGIASFGYSIYEGQVADEYHQILVSLGLALSHQASAFHSGLNSAIFTLPSGLFSNAHVSVVIGCNNGVKYNITGPFSCPGESQVSSAGSNHLAFAGRYAPV